MRDFEALIHIYHFHNFKEEKLEFKKIRLVIQTKRKTDIIVLKSINKTLKILMEK